MLQQKKLFVVGTKIMRDTRNKYGLVAPDFGRKDNVIQLSFVAAFLFD